MPTTSPPGGYVHSAREENLRPPRLCAHCGLPLAKGVRANTKYHHDCYRQLNQQRVRIRKKLRRKGLPDNAKAVAAELAKARPHLEDANVHRLLTTDLTEATALAVRLNPGGATEQLQHLLVAHGIFEEILANRMTQQSAALYLGVHPTQVSRAVQALRQRAVDIAMSAEPIPAELERLLWRVPVPETATGGWDLTEVWQWAEGAADAFLAFEERHFRRAANKLYVRKEFHRNWIVETMFAYATGGYLMILAPPRHGKSQLLVHFCTWLICRNPNIRILWVAASEDLAKDFVWAVAQQLETNDRMIRETCSVGETYAPPKRGPGTTWTKGEFTVVNRDTVLVGATMQAIGANGSILSRNADLIVTDDIESDKTVRTSGTRRATRRWYSQTLDSRKEEHTASLTIGSRQDYDDLYGYNLLDTNFRTVIERAHSLDCTKPVHDIEAHTDCVLFPEIRSYRWLHSKMVGADARAGDDDVNLFDLVYQNIAHRSGSSFWTPQLLAPCRDSLRGLGLDTIPAEGREVVAGLDPAASGWQVGFQWAFTPVKGEKVVYDPGSDFYTQRLRAQDWSVKRWMVDLDNRRGGGVTEALRLMNEWLERYGCRHWVIEDMAMQRAFTDDPRIKLWQKVNDARVEGHKTNQNKYDPKWGLGSMLRLWESELVSLPVGSAEARTKTELYESQLLSFDGNVENERQRRKDVHMASWFPMKVARRMEKELVAQAAAAAGPVDDRLSFSSYPTLTGFTNHITEAPW